MDTYLSSEKCEKEVINLIQRNGEIQVSSSIKKKIFFHS